MKILFVCTGNICRSPMAEVIFRNLCKTCGRDDVYIRGAGTSAIDGMPMTSEAYEALKRCGEDISCDMTATKFNTDMIQEFDLIIAMTSHHARLIGVVNRNVKTLDEYAGCGDIFDPFLHPVEVYIDVCKTLQSSLKVLYNILFKN